MPVKPYDLPRDLGDGLVLRCATEDDVEAIARLNQTQLPSAEAPPIIGHALAEWTRDLLGGKHPAVRATDCTVVEDTKAGSIVSSIIFISQTWAYDGVPFGVGRPELVSTHPDYRRRGLVRAQFDVLHDWSAERGHHVQIITGIPWFYRQFGYEMCVDLDCGRECLRRNVPSLKPEESEPFRLRPATWDDIDRIAKLYRQGDGRSLLTAVRDRTLWEYELTGRRTASVSRVGLRIVETTSGETAGFVALGEYIYRGMLPVSAYELEPGICWQHATPPVLRALMAEADSWASKHGDERPEGLRFNLEDEHPAFRTLPAAFPQPFGSYAYYMRVADLRAFLLHIRSVLDRRLADSPFAAFSGEVTLNFYRSGLMLKFDRGCLQDVTPWKAPMCHDGDARYPEWTFLSVLFGYRTTKELHAIWPDCTASASVEPLLDVLFPRRPSCVWPVG